MTTQDDQPGCCQAADKGGLSRALDGVGWALFFIMIGVLWLLPEGRVPEDTWIVGVGAILLVMSGARALWRVKVSACAVVLGVVALGYGLSSIYGADLPFFPILVILVGVIILIEALRKRRRG